VNGEPDRTAARLDALAIRDFRNLAQVHLELPAPGLLLVGENGLGKTNFLEAIYYLQLLRSMRGARDQDLVRFGAPGFHLSARVESDRARDVAIGFERAGKRKRVRLDGAVVDRLGDAVGAVPVVMFSPSDVELVAGGPAVRRRFLDIMLAVASRGYLRALQRYRAALVRRNAALRDAARHHGSLAGARVEVWDEPLAEHGAVLWAEREAWVTAVASRFTELCHAIGGESVAIRYAGTLPTPRTDADRREKLLRAFEDQRSLDVRFGVTRSGPHRDDLLITVSGPDGPSRELRVFGSAGQQRSAAIALRLLESETLRDRRGGTPIFLLDDPFAELDVPRTRRIVALLSDNGLGQTILAVPRESDIPGGMPRLERYRIAAGMISHD
jgi:DNA replication and repair protein RecF